ncbi:MAG TPA: isochorismatase family cysteine hydrolase [Solirubrobacterales bacterium]|jgi:ureidoacrylate peracid hydrolase|nr:isochorismatase family cysteine hydrolase [Solirubrobacterales bacterium]
MSDYETDLKVAARLSHMKPFASLPEKVAAPHTALLVIDMQNDFCAPGGLVSKDGRDLSAAQAMAERLPGLIERARAAGVLVVFVRNVYTSERNAYLSDAWLEQAARRRAGGYTRIPVCAEGSWEGDFYGEVKPRPGDPIVTKHRYSAFHNTDLDTILRANGIRTIALTGVVTNVCVETTAREGFVRDYYVVVVDDGTAAYAREDHDMTLKNIDRFFGEVTTIAELADIWGASAR